MKKLSQISESLFSDVVARGEGRSTRKEDIICYEDLDEVDTKGLYQYIIQNYEAIGPGKVVLDDKGDYGIFITIPIDMEGNTVYTEPNVFEPDKIYALNIPIKFKKYMPKTKGKVFEIEDGRYSSDGYVRVFDAFDESISNKQIIQILDRIISKLPNPGIRKKVKSTNESLFSDVVARGEGREVRKEDLKNLNINKLKCGLFLGGVYWASDQLTINDDYNISIFDFESIKKPQLKGWRLPTRNEFKKMVNDGYEHSSSYNDTYIYDNLDRKGGHIILSADELTIMQDIQGYNVIYLDEQGQIGIESIDKNDKVPTVDGNSKWTVVQLVRDDKI